MGAVSQNVQLVVLCEDRQHEVFIRRFLKLKWRDWSPRRMRVERSPRGHGSAEQFVRERFPRELQAYRSKSSQVRQGLIVMLDGDAAGVERRLGSLVDSCRLKGVQPRNDDDRVAVFVPTWCIETWFVYLNGEEVDEARADYPKLNRERDCQEHVNRLMQMCHKGTLREPAPPSLKAACEEYRARLANHES